MNRILLKSKIHRATVTETDLDYEGSLTVDEDLMSAADMLPYEQVQVYNITNGQRFETYLIKGPKGSGIIGVNGAAAHRAKVGDKLIITTYIVLEDKNTDFFMPKILVLDESNRIKKVK